MFKSGENIQRNKNKIVIKNKVSMQAIIKNTVAHVYKDTPIFIIISPYCNKNIKVFPYISWKISTVISIPVNMGIHEIYGNTFIFFC